VPERRLPGRPNCRLAGVDQDEPPACRTSSLRGRSGIDRHPIFSARLIAPGPFPVRQRCVWRGSYGLAAITAVGRTVAGRWPYRARFDRRKSCPASRLSWRTARRAPWPRDLASGRAPFAERNAAEGRPGFQPPNPGYPPIERLRVTAFRITMRVRANSISCTSWPAVRRRCGP